MSLPSFIEFDFRKVEKEIDEHDRDNVLNTLKIMLSIVYPVRIVQDSFAIKREDASYDVFCEYPPHTRITKIHLDLIQCVNPVLNNEIWVESKSNGNTIVGARVMRSGQPLQITRTLLKVIQHQVSEHSTSRVVETEETPSSTKKRKLWPW